MDDNEHPSRQTHSIRHDHMYTTAHGTLIYIVLQGIDVRRFENVTISVHAVYTVVSIERLGWARKKLVRGEIAFALQREAET